MIIRDENSYAQIWDHSTRQARRVRLLLTTLKSLITTDLSYQILELGAGQGLLSLTLAQQGYSVTAVEKSKKIFRQYLDRQSETHLKCFCQEALDFLDQNSSSRYQAIVGMGILHHIWHDQTWSKKLYQASDVNGILIFLEPNPDNPISRWIFKTNWGRSVFRLDPEEQLKNIDDIRRELLTAGWEEIQITPFDMLYPFFPSYCKELVEYLEASLPTFLKKCFSQSILIVASKLSPNSKS